MRGLRLLQQLIRAASVVAATVVLVTPLGQAGAAAPAADCTVTPRPASEFVLPADPAVAGRSLLIIEDETQAPGGTPATAADVSATQAFAELYTACQNAGDPRQLTALYSDAMFEDSLAARMYVRLPPANPIEALLALLFDPAARDRAEVQAFLDQDVAAPPIPLSPPIAVAEVRDVRVLPDGRLGAILVQDSRPTEFQIYARVDGRLLLDERINFR